MRRIFTWLAFGLFALFLARLIYLADVGRGYRFYFWVAHIPAGDKVAHIFLFGTLALLANAAMDAARWHWGKFTFLKGSLIVLIPTVLEEFSQLHFRTRTFDLLDLLADGIGIFLGGWIAVMLVRFATQWNSEPAPTQPKVGMESAASQSVE